MLVDASQFLSTLLERPDARHTYGRKRASILAAFANALLFMRGEAADLNIRGAFLHIAADALVSAGVVVAGGLALWFGWNWRDPVVSLLVAAVIVVVTERLA